MASPLSAAIGRTSAIDSGHTGRVTGCPDKAFLSFPSWQVGLGLAGPLPTTFSLPRYNPLSLGRPCSPQKISSRNEKGGFQLAATETLPILAVPGGGGLIRRPKTHSRTTGIGTLGSATLDRPGHIGLTDSAWGLREGFGGANDTARKACPGRWNRVYRHFARGIRRSGWRSLF